MATVIASELLSEAAAAEFGECPGFIIRVYAAASGGYVFTYNNAIQGHGFYGDASEAPFATVEAALAVARDPVSENSAEFYGEVA